MAGASCSLDSVSFHELVVAAIFMIFAVVSFLFFFIMQNSFSVTKSVQAEPTEQQEHSDARISSAESRRRSTTVNAMKLASIAEAQPDFAPFWAQNYEKYLKTHYFTKN